MQIVIDIPEKIYSSLSDAQFGGYISEWVFDSVKVGTPLPKGHEDLIERKCGENLCRGCEHSDICDIYNAPTIIEADEE